MKVRTQLMALAGVVASVIALSISSTAAAHVTVKPAEVETAARQTFAVGVPNEKEIPTTEVKVVMPQGIASVMPFQKSGWEITVEKEDSGESAIVKSITWKGGEVAVGFRDEFMFSGKVPAKATELQWKAYQTYADGTVVSWDKAKSDRSHGEDSNSGPFSVTKVVGETEAAARISKAEQTAADAKKVANRGTYVGIAGIAIGLLAVYLATRNKQ